MPSFVAWLDYSEHERRQALDVIDLFRERETRDELGLGPVRDALAEMMFPGISTIQTRAKYFLFVPWTYLELERRKLNAADAKSRAWKEEIALIEVLINAGERDGVIGIEARAALKRLPSDVYWAGLGTFKIRRFDGSREDCHAAVGAAGKMPPSEHEPGESAPTDSTRQSLWDPHLPPRPKKFPEGATLSLTPEEASYLRDRIRTWCGGSYLAHLVEQPIHDRVPFPWDHPGAADADEAIKRLLHQARCFSEALQGPALLYNLMLAQKAKHDDLTERYRDAMAIYVSRLGDREQVLRAWSLDELWRLAPEVRLPTRAFVVEWLRLALPAGKVPSPETLMTSSAARDLVHQRERTLKRAQARLDNDAALRNWGGAAGAGQIDYRWGRAQTIVRDIVEGLGASDA